MKRGCIILLLVAMYMHAVSQLNTGGFHALFGVDADTKGGYMKYGPLTGMVISDDWFASSTGTGNGVIDTSNAAYYQSLLQAGNNVSFSKRMPVPLYTNVNGKIWLDAVYRRDYIVSTGSDSTTFTGGSKNGDDPANWFGTVSAVPDKTDLVDVYGHMRRNGTTIHDSLWFFTAVATMGTSGARYFDIELYKNHITYNATAGRFSTGGTDAGHTQWLFDASGNIVQTGDMIIAVTYSSGAPTVEVRIWVSQTTYTTVTPNLFNFGSSFNGSTAAYGYASIVSKTGTTAFGSGIANYSATPASDTTYATPWGSASASQAWDSQYQSLQFIEVGLNLTRIGLDPALYTSVLGSGACQSSFASIFFKSRSSPSFTSNLQDFAGPLDFLQTPVLDYTLNAPVLSCSNTAGTINVLNNTTAGYYTWSTINGSITGTASNSVDVNKGGSYIIQAAVAQGCPVVRTDTITVAVDTFPPVASFYTTVTADMGHFQFHGGNTSASNYTTPFGGSQGLSWNWSGPGGFTANQQNPLADTIMGTYRLVVTEQRNGCTDTATDYINFVVLSSARVVLKAMYTNASVVLKWHTTHTQMALFEIERSHDGIHFIKIGTLPAGPAALHTGFTDMNPARGLHLYRVKMITSSGQTIYSNIVTFDTHNKETRLYYLVRNNFTGTNYLVVNSPLPANGKVIIYTLSGAVAAIKDIAIQQGQHTIALPATGLPKNSTYIVRLLMNGQVVFTRKTIL